MTTTQITDNQKRLIELAYTRSCLRIDAQQEIANSSDQRALVFSTLSIAAAALIFGSLNTQQVREFAIGSALLFGLAALSSALSALPQTQYSTGSHAKDLGQSIQEDTNEHMILMGLSSNNDGYIDFNEASARRRAHFYRFGVFVFIAGVLVAALGFVYFDPSLTQSGVTQ